MKSFNLEPTKKLKIIIFCGALICVLSNVNSPEVSEATNGVNVAHRPSESVLGGTQESKPLTPEDYYVPLDNWLKKQGSPLNGKDFYDVGKAYKLDPDFLIAVTKAETQLGMVRQRGSACNVGSVGSYDSTNTTFGCSSYKHGIEQIAQTVNNKMLGHYTKITQLSRAHNKNQNPVYATSDGNWYRNVVTTMNQLKGKNEADYEFRRP